MGRGHARESVKGRAFLAHTPTPTMQIPKRRAQMLRTHSMTDKINYMTAEGLEKLKEEQRYLKAVKTRELAERLDSARQLGDLSENAEYQEAKHQLGQAQTRILQIGELLKTAQIITHGEGTDAGTIRVGSKVVVEVRGKEKTYEIVGSNEVDLAAGRISNESPIGEAFLGHVKGDEVKVETPGGTNVYKIVDVK